MPNKAPLHSAWLYNPSLLVFAFGAGSFQYMSVTDRIVDATNQRPIVLIIYRDKLRLPGRAEQIGQPGPVPAEAEKRFFDFIDQ